MLVGLTGVMPAAAAPEQQEEDPPVIREISSELSTSLPAVTSRGDVFGVEVPEIRSEEREAEGAAPQSVGVQPFVNRSESHKDDDDDSPPPLKAPRVKGSNVTDVNPELFVAFQGLNHRDQRLANNGNQYSVEPPDQGLCVGNGFVFETVNDVLRVYDSSGNPLTDVIDLNSFYGYEAAIIRPDGPFGPFVTDPSCYYDPDTGRWFHVVLTLDVDSETGDFTGKNHLDLAVSKTDDPTGDWKIYRIAAQDDGTDDTPDHGCSQGPCIGDYPHIGADQYGFYITTNEYSFFGPEYKSAQIYALSKEDLAANKSKVKVVQFSTRNRVHSKTGRQPGFTIWPATSPDSIYNTEAEGTEFFLSSNAAEEANAVPGGTFSDEIVVWALTNTQSLNSSKPDLDLSNKVLDSEVYGIPPLSQQKAGDIPLAQCINNKTLPTPFGKGCWQILFTEEPGHHEKRSKLDSNDSRMQQVWYADGKLWGALDTVVRNVERKRAGIAYFVVSPQVNKDDHVTGEIAMQGYVAVTGNNVNYPAIAVLPSGVGIMAFTLVGKDYYPSAAYVPIDINGTGDVHIAGAGVGPEDGFTGYDAFGETSSSRWGDYGAAVTDGTNIWIASEYIAQTCTFEEYVAGVTKDSLGQFGSCGGTRTALANWSTHISGVTP